MTGLYAVSDCGGEAVMEACRGGRESDESRSVTPEYMGRPSGLGYVM